MKRRIDNYTFVKGGAGAGTVAFDDITTIKLEAVLLITNVAVNVIIYNFADPTKGGAVATNVLTLDFDTSAQASTDKLQIFYDEGDAFHDEVDIGAPTKMGGIAKATAPTAVADGDRVNAWLKPDGSQCVSQPTPADLNMTEASAAGIKTAVDAIDAGKLEEATFTGRVGEVQASPTANTILARLKDIDDALVLLKIQGELNQGSAATGTNPVMIAAEVEEQGGGAAGTDGDIMRLKCDEFGALRTIGGGAIATHFDTEITIVHATAFDLITPATDHGIRIKEVAIHWGADCTVNGKVLLKFSAGSEQMQTAKFAPGSGIVRGVGDAVLFKGAKDGKLQIINDVPTSGSFTVNASYDEVPL